MSGLWGTSSPLSRDLISEHAACGFGDARRRLNGSLQTFRGCLWLGCCPLALRFWNVLCLPAPETGSGLATSPGHRFVHAWGLGEALASLGPGLSLPGQGPGATGSLCLVRQEPAGWLCCVLFPKVVVAIPSGRCPHGGTCVLWGPSGGLVGGMLPCGRGVRGCQGPAWQRERVAPGPTAPHRGPRCCQAWSQPVPEGPSLASLGWVDRACLSGGPGRIESPGGSHWGRAGLGCHCCLLRARLGRGDLEPCPWPQLLGAAHPLGPGSSPV